MQKKEKEREKEKKKKKPAECRFHDRAIPPDITNAHTAGKIVDTIKYG